MWKRDKSIGSFQRNNAIRRKGAKEESKREMEEVMERGRREGEREERRREREEEKRRERGGELIHEITQARSATIEHLHSICKTKEAYRITRRNKWNKDQSMPIVQGGSKVQGGSRAQGGSGSKPVNWQGTHPSPPVCVLGLAELEDDHPHW